jgi:hypothetical protein
MSAKHPFRLAIETGAKPDAFKALFAPNAVIYAPMLSYPIEGRDNVFHIISTAAKVAGPLRYTRELNDGRQTFLFWSGTIEGFELQAVTVLIDNDRGEISEIRVLMRTWPIVTLFQKAMKESLGDSVPAKYWELAPRNAPKGADRKFTPISLTKIELAPDIELHSPMLARSLKGMELVRPALKLAHSVQSASSYTSIFAKPDFLVELFDCDASGYPMEGIWVSKIDPNGQINDLTVYLRPYPAVSVLRNEAKAIAESDPDLAFLGRDYWELIPKA